MNDKNLSRMMLFSFIYGGFLLVVYLLQIYSVVWRQELLPPIPGIGTIVPGVPVAPNDSVARHLPLLNSTDALRREADSGLLPTLASPVSILLLMTGIAFIINGYFLWKYTTDRKVTQAKHDVYSAMLTGDEKEVFDSLKGAGGALTQKEVSQKTGFSAVRTHRVINRLKSKGAISVVPFGMTNKILLTSGNPNSAKA